MTGIARINGGCMPSGFRYGTDLLVLALRRPALSIVLGVVTALACAAFAVASGYPAGVVMAAVFFASLGGSIGGVAFSALCGVVLFRIDIDPVRAIQIMMTCSIANQAVMTYWLRREINWRALRIFLIGGLLGLPLGLWLLLHVDHHLYTGVLGGFLTSYGGYMLVRAPAVVRVQHPALDLVAGVLSGITGAAAAFPSAGVTVWCGLKGWDKGRQRAIFQPFILIMQIASLTAISLATGTGVMHGTGAAQSSGVEHGSGFSPGDLLYVPSALLGTFIGLRLYQRFSTRQFAVALNVLLIVAGVSFLI